MEQPTAVTPAAPVDTRTAVERQFAGPPRTPWQALPWLYFAPRRFFGSVNLEAAGFWVVAVWCDGIVTAIDRIDQKLLRVEAGQELPGYIVTITSNWLAYFGFVLMAGAVAGALVWGIGGWWYKIRIRWSGAVDPDPHRARLVYMTSSFVLAAPCLLYSAALPFFYPDYRTAWDEDPWSSLLLAFVVWSVVVSYRGVTTCFAVERWRARLWFLILPLLVYSVALGAFVVLLGLVDPA